MAKHKTIKFGESRQWLNPDNESLCTASIIWRVDIVIPRDENTKPWLDAIFTASDQASTHWYVGRKADLRPLQRLNRTTHQFIDACNRAIQYAKDNGIDLDVDDWSEDDE